MGATATAADQQECTVEFEHYSVGIGEAVPLVVLFLITKPAGCGAGKKVPLKHEPFGGAESPEDYSLTHDTVTLESDGTSSLGFRVVDDTISNEYDEGAYVFFGDLPSGVTAGDTDTMTVYINDNDGPIRQPGPPRNLRADAGDGQVALSWLPPADTGAAAIQLYEYRHAKASEPYTLDWKTVAGGADARSVTVADLDNGTEYKFEVQAVNRFGAGKEAEVTATPAVPSVLAIGDVTVDEGDGTAVLEVTLTPASVLYQKCAYSNSSVIRGCRPRTSSR